MAAISFAVLYRWTRSIHFAALYFTSVYFGLPHFTSFYFTHSMRQQRLHRKLPDDDGCNGHLPLHRDMDPQCLDTVLNHGETKTVLANVCAFNCTDNEVFSMIEISSKNKAYDVILRRISTKEFQCNKQKATASQDYLLLCLSQR